ncbi:MAG: hypothetical protein EOO59_17200, partial [Hymenobacter sp.]
MLLLALGLPQGLRAQEVSATVKVPLTKRELAKVLRDTVREKPAPPFSHRRLVVQYDSRYSIINSHFCTINGLKL